MILLFDTEQNRVHDMIEELKLLYPLYTFHIFPMVSINRQKLKNLSKSLSEESFRLWLKFNDEVLKSIIERTKDFNNDHIFALNIRDERSKEVFESLVDRNKYKKVTDDIFNNEKKNII